MPDVPPLRCRCGRVIGATDVPAKGCCPDWLMPPRIGLVHTEGGA